MAIETTTQFVDTDYLPIPVELVFPSRSAGVDFYIEDHEEASLRLYRGSDFPIDDADLAKLREGGISKLYISAAEHRQFQDHLRENLNDILIDESLGVKERFSSLNEVIRSVLSDAFSRSNDDETVRLTNDLARDTVSLICRDDMVPRELLSVLYHDYYTFTHSANVSYYCVMLAKRLGADQKDLHAIATGGMLHDLGKLEVSEKILLKPGKLTDTEFDIVKRHPSIGFTRLNKREELSFGQLMMVYQHHERANGSGYPVGSVAGEIHAWARICAVVDVFEAMTSNRPYRARMPMSEAFSIMDRQSGSGFDEEMLRCWKSIICSK